MILHFLLHTFLFKNKYSRITSILVICLFTPSLEVTSTNYNKVKFYNINSDTGLSSNTIFCTHQDSKDFLWIGTQHGLNRFDGTNYRYFFHNEEDSTSLCGNTIYKITEDKDGLLWIVSNKGIDIFDVTTCKVVNHMTLKEVFNNKLDLTVNFIHNDSKNRIWIGTNKGLSIYDIGTSSFVKEKENILSNKHVSSICEDKNQNIWIGTNEGIYQLSLKLDIIKHYTYNKQNVNTIPTNKITALFIDSKDLLWIGGTGGKIGSYTYTEGKDLRKTIFNKKLNTSSNSYIVGFTEDFNENIWIAYSWQGVASFNKKNQKLSFYKNNEQDPHSLSWNVILSIYTTKCGTIWIGTYGTGCNYWHPSLRKFNIFQKKFNSKEMSIKSVKCISADSKNRIWISGYGDSNLNIIDPKGETIHILDKKLHTISYFHLDKQEPDKYMWFTSNRDDYQLFKFSIEENKVVKKYSFNLQTDTTLLTNTIQLTRDEMKFFKIYEDSSHLLWISSSKGLIEFSKNDESFVVHKTIIPIHNNPSEKINSVYCIHYESKERIWVGTYSGLYLYNAVTKKQIPYNNTKDSTTFASSLYILDLQKGLDDELWIATNSGLYCLQTQSDSIKHFTTKNGLKTNLIITIEKDFNDNLWCSSSMGILSLNLHSHEIHLYDLADGLQSNNFAQSASYITANGQIMMGGINGFNTFYPDEIILNTYIPPIYFTNFKLFNKDANPNYDLDSTKNNHTLIEYTKKVTLTPDDKVVSFGFSAINFLRAEKVQYAYFLEGLDKEWNYIGNRNQVTFTNLEPKTYKLKVKAANNDGLWNKTGTDITIEVIPPIYQRTWFRMLMIVIIIAIGFSIYYVRVTVLKRNERKLLLLVRERTSELSEINTILEEKSEEILIQKEMLVKQNHIISNKNEEITTQNEELYHHRNELERSVKIRTEELQIAMEQAKESDRLKTAFLANMSHEIRTPMNAILGFSTLIISPEISEEEKPDFYNQVKVNSEALLRLIDDIIDISKIESNQLKLSFSDININEVFSELRSTINQELISKEKQNVNLILTNNTQHIKLHTDEHRLKQVMTNLLNNASKFTDTGSITFGYKPTPNNTIYFFVTDTGIGIPEGLQESVFNRFEKASPGKQKLYRGTGLGLSISKQLVLLLGGDLKLESIEKKGSTFYFELPITIVR